MTQNDAFRVLAIGATGSIGRHVVEAGLRAGHQVRALMRQPGKVRFPAAVEVVAGDLTRPETLGPVLEDIDAIVFTHGTTGGGKAGAEAVDYGGVRNVLAALGDRLVRVALMSTIGVTDRKGAHDWKRRGERLLRASGLLYTIVRPGWFDYQEAGQHRLVLLQGDTRQSGTPRDGVIARTELAAVLVASLTSAAAAWKTFELVADAGPQQADFEPLFGALDPDAARDFDGAHDAANMPPAQEPAAIQAELAAVLGRRVLSASHSPS